MARWFRARSLLRSSEQRILDLGCAFGFLTERLGDRWAVGIEEDPDYLRRASRGRVRRYLRGVGEALPFRSASFEAILFLDVLEHVQNEQQVIAEIRRVLRPGGTLILSVPGDGWLAWADSQNLYDSLKQRLGAKHGHRHRHYRLEELQSLLGPELPIDIVQRTGIGLAEFVNLALLVLCRDLLRLPKLYDYLQYLYFSLYLAEDLVSFGGGSYHTLIRAGKATDASR